MSEALTTLLEQPRPDAGDGPLLSVQDLAVSFGAQRGRVRVVDGLSFDIHPGETVAVLGESGSGKSVTAQTIMGLLPKPIGRVDAGRILYRGVDLLQQPASYTRSLGGTEIAMIFQDPLSSLNPVMRVGAQIGEAMRRRAGVSRREARERAIELMERVGIPAARRRVDDFPHQFSGGMRQRVMIAMALALRPSLIIADEPTTALDVTVQAQIMALLAEVQELDGTALLLITHDLGVVADVADRTVVMYSGRVAESGAIRDVYDRPAHPYTVGLMASVPDLEGPRGRLTPIEGSPPDPRRVPQGCPFHPRCPMAVALCAEVRPEPREMPGRTALHLSACHRAEEVGA
ncbi:ABC transporter ATP-binding protein [Protaetiibacter sp. SSC-01]|uniref:ABC transporter ATP-binding protein n=1 Tax=Protaetiibacter sp. SSC-01 TaxID=2759943 RepID=UPI001656C03E|nr:ABC transporter ATP-binding protein [Protaetiibacter sp. SSC-01]QNO37821.1 ABC transporter ATP-binding protein [Protaetiibacter sp. SSC-01]